MYVCVLCWKWPSSSLLGYYTGVQRVELWGFTDPWKLRWESSSSAVVSCPCRVPPSSPEADSVTPLCSLHKSNHFSPPSATACRVIWLPRSPRASGHSINLHVHSAWYHIVTTHIYDEGPFSRAGLQMPNPCKNTPSRPSRISSFHSLKSAPLLWSQQSQARSQTA